MAGYEQLRIVWRKSTASNSGGCVEVAAVGHSLPRFQVGNQSGMGQELIRSLTERYEP